MEKQVIENSLIIDAPKERVWDVLTKDELNRIWYAEFNEGTYAETDWKVGSKVIFTDSSKSGLIGTVTVNKLNEELVIEYIGEYINGKEDYDSENAEKLKGAKETYILSEKDGKTYLDITGDMDPDFCEMMSEAWERAMRKIKELAERK